jgi:hypothetical protein
LLACAAALTFGCDFGIGGGSGCLRVTQGDYTFPIKRVVDASVVARLTASGIDFLTARVRSLVLAFFDADAEGRAIIPLGSLGLGDISTSLGPFEAEVRDLVLTLDLSRLDVRLVPGSNPARLEVYVEDAEVGLADGTVVGAVDSAFFTGDAACGLGNGANGRVARLTMRLLLELATDPRGALAVKVLPSSFDLQDISLALETDCNLPECLDGLSPGDDGECLECETICPVGDLASGLASRLQSAFDRLLDDLLDLLADDLANLVLDGFLNGRPLAVEGELDIAALLGPLLSWMDSARPLGLLMKPAGTAFQIAGAGPSLGLDVTLDAGLDATVHPCVTQLAADRTFTAAPRPMLDGLAQTAVGPVPYDVGVALSEAIVNEAVFALWKSGALCIRAASRDLAALTEGGLVIDASTLDLLLPGIASLAGPDAPIRISVLPALDRGPDYVAFGDGVSAPHVGVSLIGASVSVEAMVGEAWLTLLRFEADLGLGFDLQPRVDGRLELRLANVDLKNLGLPDNELFGAARLEVIAPFVVELALGFLAARPLTFDLGLDGLGASLGVPLTPTIVAIGPAGAGDWLGIYIQLADAALPRRAPKVAPTSHGAGYLDFRAFVSDSERFQILVGAGAWSRTFSGPGPHRLEGARLWLDGAQSLATRAIGGEGLGVAGEAEIVVTLPAPERATLTNPNDATSGERPKSEASASAGEARPGDAAPGGCASGPGGSPVALVFAVLLVVRRQSAWPAARSGFANVPSAASAARVLVPLGVVWRALAPIAASLGALSALFAGCADAAAPERACVSSSQCDDGFFCGPSQRCEPASACEDDDDCCPGAVCFSGTCRPTSECDAGRPCVGLGEVCENEQCVPASCSAELSCPAGLACVAGRCLFGAPCDGRCPGGSACDVCADRCVPVVSPCECPDGVAVAEVTGDALMCSAACRCEPKSGPEATPGVDGRLVSLADGPLLLSYDPVHGDLVGSRFADGGRTDAVLDGEDGGDVGERVAAVVSGAEIEAIYRDRDRNRVLFGRFDLGTGARVTYDLPVDGLEPGRDGAGDARAAGADLGVGRFSCLTKRPDGRLAGLVFVPADPSDAVSMLVRIESRVARPEASDWVATTVLETPLPPRAEAPCGETCGFTSLCVLGEGPGAPEVCGRLLDAGRVGGASCGTCGPREVCVEVDGVRACRTRVERRDDVDRLPFGEGLFLTCATTPAGEVVGAWYDADARRLLAGRWPFGPGDREVVDAAVGRDPGHFASIAAYQGGIGIAYQDAVGPEFRFATAGAIGAPWRFETLARGGGHGAWARLTFDGTEARVAAANTASGEVALFARRGGCWGSRVVFGAGTHGMVDLLVSAGGNWVSARGWGFDPDLRPRHGPALLRVETPSCP